MVCSILQVVQQQLTSKLQTIYHVHHEIMQN